jgi:hypothetical protein
VPLHTGLEPDFYMMPLLQAQIGWGNYIMNSYLSWVELRIADIPNEELEARAAVYDAMSELELKKDKWNDWVNNYGGQLAMLREERAMLNYNKTSRDEKSSFSFSLVDRKEMDVASKLVTEKMQPLMDAKRELKAVCDLYSQIVKDRKEALKRLKRNRKHSDSPVSNKLEATLSKVGIERTAYHGGDLNGKYVEKLFQEAKYRGIGDFVEDFIEHAHQFGMKDEKRTANMRDKVNGSMHRFCPHQSN